MEKYTIYIKKIFFFSMRFTFGNIGFQNMERNQKLFFKKKLFNLLFMLNWKFLFSISNSIFAVILFAKFDFS